MNLGTIVIVLLCLVGSLKAEEQPFKKVIHNTDPNAKCIDGSPPAIYIPSGSEPDKFVIFMYGGGFCSGATLLQTLESCYQRSKT